MNKKYNKQLYNMKINKTNNMIYNQMIWNMKKFSIYKNKLVKSVKDLQKHK